MISIAVFTVILISFNQWFEYYLRKSLETEFNKSLNAVVSIGNVDMKFLSGQIVIEDFVIVGKNEFAKDTLISCGSIIAEPGAFDSKTSTLNFKRLVADNLTIKTIISESGSSNWDNLIVDQDTSISEGEEQTKMFLEKLVITDGLLEYEDRNKEMFYSLENIDLVMNFSEDSAASSADYNFHASYFRDSSNVINLSLSGNLKSNETITDFDAQLFIGKIPVKIKASLPNDSLGKSQTKIEALADFSGLNFDNFYSEGKLNFNLDFAQNFNSAIFNIEADSIEFFRPDSSSLFFADFKLNSNFNVVDQLNLSVEFRNCYILSNGSDTLSGDFSLNLSDSALNINSDLNGKLNLNIPFSYFGDIKGSIDSKIQINSNLNYYCSSDSEISEGQIELNAKMSNPLFTITTTELFFNKNIFTSNITVGSKIFNAIITSEIGDFQDYFKDGTVKTHVNLDIDKLCIPVDNKNNNKILMDRDESLEMAGYKFPKSFDLDILISIDTLCYDNYKIFNLNSKIALSPNLLLLKSEDAIIGTGKLQYEFSISREELDTIYYTMIRLSSLDLDYFSQKDNKISGLLEIDSENTLYSKSSTTKNSGKNLVSLKGFKMPVSFLKEYGIDEDNLTISDFDLIAVLYSDSLKIQPCTININKLQAAISGSYNYSKDNLSFSLLLDAPDSYLSPEIKIALAVFSEKSAVKLPKKKGRIIRHLKIVGSFSEPKFVMFE